MMCESVSFVLLLLKVVLLNSTKAQNQKTFRRHYLVVCEVQYCLFIGDYVKVQSLPHSMAQQISHLPLLCDDNQVHAFQKKEKAEQKCTGLSNFQYFTVK